MASLEGDTMDEPTSRERMLQAISHVEPDRVPFCYMIFELLRTKCRDDYEFVERQLEMGLDATVALPMFGVHAAEGEHDVRTLPVKYHPDVEIRERVEERAGAPYPVLVKEYHTPAGVLTAKVNKTNDWPFGNQIPLMDDYLVPRSRKFLIEDEGDLSALRYLLVPPRSSDVRVFHRQSARARKFAAQHGVMVTGGWGVGIEAAIWLCGLRSTMIAAIQRPGFVQELAEILHAWNVKRMAVFLNEGVDLYIRRGWYENTHFWSPQLFRRFVLPYLKAEVRTAHRAGAKFGYIMTSGCMPLLDMFIEAGIDVLIGVDPVQGKGTDLEKMKAMLQGRVCLWGGVNGYITVEMGKKDAVQAAVSTAIRTLAPSGGFILSPVDNVRDTSEKTWQNVEAMLRTWERLAEYPYLHPHGG